MFSGNMRRTNNQMAARGGPLATDHLQDLELELELLKRKRQLIQNQQQEMLYNRAPAVDTLRYSQPSQSFNDRYNEPQRFSQSYNDAPLDNQSFGLKRRAQPDWSNDYDMGGNKRAKQGTFDRFPTDYTPAFQRPSQPQPLLALPNYQRQPNRRGPQPLMGKTKGPQPFKQGPQPFKQGPQPFKQGPKNFSLGPKPPSQHSNFKRNIQPGPNRPGVAFNKPPTPKKPSPVKTPNTTPKASKKAPILVPDEMPSNKTNGRLELALGMIIKEIRAAYSNNPEYKYMFQTMPLCRIMKQGIRERLHAVMAGKVVGVVPDIVAEYRKKHPVDTDIEIVELAATEKRNTDHITNLVVKLFEEGDPEQYFKKQMGRVLENTWSSMMHKLEKVLNEDKNKIPTLEEILQHIPDIKSEDDKASGSETETKPEEKPADDATQEKLADNVNQEKPADNVNQEKSADNFNQEKPAEENAGETANESVTEIDVKPVVAAVEDIPKKSKDEEIAAYRKRKDYDKWMSMLLQRRLPQLLNKNKDYIIKLFDLDNMFRNSKAAIIINANKKAQAMNAKKQNKTHQQDFEDLKVPRGEWYFVKVLATPAMPKRKMMQEFLNQFKPKTIKRHKKNYNLLFVGLDSKENYDKMLAADQIAVGNATLTIAGSTNKANSGDKTETDIDSVLTPQLDDQIDDLLSSIRKADEESSVNESIDLTDPKDTVQQITDSQDATEVTDPQDGTQVTDSNGNEKPEDNGKDAAEKADDPVELKDDDCEVVEANGKEVVTVEDDDVAPLKSDEAKATEKAPGTPAKGKAPATPSSIRTRRSSRLQN